jgi:hypothetical protein
LQISRECKCSPPDSKKPAVRRIIAIFALLSV